MESITSEQFFKSQVLAPVLKHIAAHPDWPAFYIADRSFTYAEFGHCIAGIRMALCGRCGGPAETGLVVNDDLETYASIFALWLEGRAYVPLHPGQPLERCMDIAGQVGLKLILDSSAQSRYDPAMVLATAGLCGDGLPEVPPPSTDDTAPAYILFTSGSTGKPKGVIITRGNVAAFMDAFFRTGIQLGAKDRCLQCFDLTFDVSVQSYLAPLVSGATIYTVPYDQIKYVYAAGLIEEHRLTFGAMAPSMLRYLKPYFDEIDVSSLRCCILTAEACPLALMEEWWKCTPEADLYDFYGPTEATIYCTYYKLSRKGGNRTLNGIISIGRPLEGMTALVVDEQLRPLPDGEKGELCIAGPQLTPGYWNNPERNAEVFFERVVEGRTLRFYRTGDLCYRETDGNLMYSGRLDYQAKIQGFRVELGEIEYHAREFLKGPDAVAVAFDNEAGLTEIALFVESEPHDTHELTTYLRNRMPAYMIPSVIRFEAVFPLNTNGKTDRKQLNAMLCHE